MITGCSGATALMATDTIRKTTASTAQTLVVFQKHPAKDGTFMTSSANVHDIISQGKVTGDPVQEDDANNLV